MKRILKVILLLLSLSIFCIKVSANDDVYISMKNGDFSISGFGSVTEELNSYGIDVFSYQLGVKENKALMMSEGDRNIYIYIYDKNGYSDYDKVSLSSYYGDSAKRPTINSKDLEWQEFDIMLVSYDSTKHLQKYLVKELSFLNDTYHSIYVREIYNQSKRDQISFVFGVGFVYQYNPNTKQSKVDTEEIIRVTNKKVAYELYPQTEGTIDYIWQRNYVAFSTDKKMDDLFEVKLKFNGFDYSAYTDIELNSSSNEWDLKKAIQDFSKVLTNKNVYSHIDKTRFFEKGTIYKDEQISIKNEEINLSYSNGFWWSNKTGNWTYKTIEKTSILKDNNVSLSDSSILNYDYVLSFDNRKVDCFTFGTGHFKVLWKEYKSVGGVMVGVNAKGGGDIVYSITKNPFATPSFTADKITNAIIKANVDITKNRMLEVEDLTLLEFHYMDNGEVKHAIAVDTYNDSLGGNQFTDNTTKTPFDNFFKILGNFFRSSVFERIVKIVVIGVIVIIILSVIIKCIFKSIRRKEGK